MDTIAEFVAIANHFSVDEDNHMLPNLSLLVEYVPTGTFVFAKVIIQHRTKVRTGGFSGRTRDVALNVLRESYCGHKLHNSTGKGFPTAIVPVTLAEFLPISMKNVFFGLQYRR